MLPVARFGADQVLPEPYTTSAVPLKEQVSFSEAQRVPKPDPITGAVDTDNELRTLDALELTPLEKVVEDAELEDFILLSAPPHAVKKIAKRQTPIKITILRVVM